MEGNQDLADTYDGSMQYTAPHIDAPQRDRIRLAYANFQAPPSSLQKPRSEKGADMSSREEIAAKLAASEARTDAKLAVFQGQFDRLSDKLDNIAAVMMTQRTEAAAAHTEQRAEATSNRNTVTTTIYAVGFALAGLLVAIAAYSDSVFSRGMSVRDVVDKAVQDIQSRQLPPTK